MPRMNVPDWRASTAGTRTRVALWLVSEAGLGGSFTKTELRQAFPAVEQVDRRMRDLRTEGWVIATYREDRSLAPEELRLVTIGGHVWERGYRSRGGSTVTEKERAAVFLADGFACAQCGIGGGEPYPDDPLRTAKLVVQRLPGPAGEPAQLRTLCDRCHVAAKDPQPDDEVLRAVQELEDPERELLRRWVSRGKRPASPAEQLWARYRRLPDAARKEIQHYLEGG